MPEFVQALLLDDMIMFGTVTNKEIVDVQRAFNTRCYSFNYGIDFQAKQGDRKNAALRYTHFLVRDVKE